MSEASPYECAVWHRINRKTYGHDEEKQKAICPGKEKQMGKILIGSVFVFIAFVDFCCCRASSLAEQRMERMLLTDRGDAE